MTTWCKGDEGASSLAGGRRRLPTRTSRRPDMAGRTLDRRELRRQAEQSGSDDPHAGTAVVPPGKKVRAKIPAAPRARKPRAKKAPTRMRVRWGVFDGGMKQVAIFDYNQHAAADEKLADLLAKKKGSYFIQPVREPMPEPVPAETPPAE